MQTLSHTGGGAITGSALINFHVVHRRDGIKRVVNNEKARHAVKPGPRRTP